MTHLRGSAELALAGPADIDRYREALADCVEEADRVLVMLTTLMDISEAESGAIELHREMVPLSGIVARGRGSLPGYRGARGVTLESASMSGWWSRSNRLRLEQVAAKPARQRHQVQPPGGRVEISVEREDNRAVLRVRDAGIGIPPAELPRIWERLFRGDQSRTERGLGLGLTLSKPSSKLTGGLSPRKHARSGFDLSVNLSYL